MSAGYDPFYWLDRDLDKEYEENMKEIERELENDKKRINNSYGKANTSDF